MSNFKTIADFANESGMTQAKIRALLKDVKPEITLGRSVGYHPDAVRAALINKYKDELSYLGVPVGELSLAFQGYTSQY